MSLGFLDQLLKQLIADEYIVILSRGRRKFDVAFRHERLFVYDFINESRLLPRIDLYIYHGSALSTYNGLYYGVPMISIAVQADQHFHSEAVVRLGVGRLFRPVQMRVAQVVEASRELLGNRKVQLACEKVKNELQAFDQRGEVIDRIKCLCEPAVPTENVC